MSALLQALAAAIPGGLCRCAKCCCKPGLGHNSPQYALYEAEMLAEERYEDAKATGLSDHEAREEGWPQADISPLWDGVGDTPIRDWVTEPGRVRTHWVGMAYELLYVPTPGARPERLELGNRLGRRQRGSVFILEPVEQCSGEHHVTPHRGCILR